MVIEVEVAAVLDHNLACLPQSVIPVVVVVYFPHWTSKAHEEASQGQRKEQSRQDVESGTVPHGESVLNYHRDTRSLQPSCLPVGGHSLAPLYHSLLVLNKIVISQTDGVVRRVRGCCCW